MFSLNDPLKRALLWIWPSWNGSQQEIHGICALFIWFFFCLVGVFPIRKDHNYDLWWPGGIDILWVHSLWHGQHNKAVLLWRVYLGICCALPWHYQSFLESSHHFESIWTMNSQVHYYSKYHFRKSFLRYGHLRQFPEYGVCKCRNLSGLFFPVQLVFS